MGEGSYIPYLLFVTSYIYFIFVEEGVDVVEMETAYCSPRSVKARKDVIVVHASYINIVLEAGNVEKTIPLLTLQSSILGIATMTPAVVRTKY